jgi:hypothetical protein
MRLSGFPRIATMKFLDEPACRNISEEFSGILGVGKAFPFDKVVKATANVL